MLVMLGSPCWQIWRAWGLAWSGASQSLWMATAQCGASVFSFAKADEECQCQAWGLPHYNSNEPCSECLANRTDKPFADLKVTTAWRSTAPSLQRLTCARVRRSRHPVLASPLATRMMCYLDLMHLVDCKGVASWLFGGVLFFLLKEPALGPTRKLRLDRVNSDRIVW